MRCLGLILQPNLAAVVTAGLEERAEARPRASHLKCCAQSEGSTQKAVALSMDWSSALRSLNNSKILDTLKDHLLGL